MLRIYYCITNYPKVIKNQTQSEIQVGLGWVVFLLHEVLIGITLWYSACSMDGLGFLVVFFICLAPWWRQLEGCAQLVLSSSPCSLKALPHGLSKEVAGLLTWQLRALRSMVLRDSKWNCLSLTVWAQKLTQCYFWHSLLVRSVTEPPQNQKKGHWSHLSVQRVANDSRSPLVFYERIWMPYVWRDFMWTWTMQISDKQLSARYFVRILGYF